MIKYYLRKIKFNKSSGSEATDEIIETEISKEDLSKQVVDKNFDKTQIHICGNEEGIPCEVKDL